MTDTRKRNANWTLIVDNEGRVSTANAQLAVLMDIREHLASLLKIMRCPNVQQMALAAQRIDKRLAKKLPLRKGA